MRLPVELEHRVAAEDDRVLGQVVARRHRGALELRQLEGQLGGRQARDLVLVHAGHDHDRLDTGAAQGREAGG